MKKLTLAGLSLLMLSHVYLHSQIVVSEKNSAGPFAIVVNQNATPVYVDANDHAVNHCEIIF